MPAGSFDSDPVSVLAFLLLYGAPALLLACACVLAGVLVKEHVHTGWCREAAAGKLAIVPCDCIDERRPVADARIVTASVVVPRQTARRLLSKVAPAKRGFCCCPHALDRGRREAVQRLQAQYPDADAILNLRIETAPLDTDADLRADAVEVIAYGTAVRYC